MKTKRLLKTLGVVMVMMVLSMEGFAQTYSKVYMQGNATVMGWSEYNRSDRQALLPEGGTDLYVGYQYLKPGDFKFMESKDTWGGISFKATSKDEPIIVEQAHAIQTGGDDYKFMVTKAGFYKIELDLRDTENMTVTLTDLDELNTLVDSNNADAGDIRVIGSATNSDWDAENPEIRLVRDRNNTFMFSGVGYLKAGGTFKFLTTESYEGLGFREDKGYNQIFITKGYAHYDNNSQFEVPTSGDYHIFINLATYELVVEPMKLFIVGGNNLSKWSPEDGIELKKEDNSYKFKGIVHLNKEDMRTEPADPDPTFKLTVVGVDREDKWAERYFFFRDPTDARKITKDKAGDRKWSTPGNETGEYMFEVDIKEQTISMTKLNENNLANQEKVFITTGSYCGTDVFSTLIGALGNNKVITSLQFGTDVNSGLAALDNINPNCLIYLPEGTVAPTAWDKNIVAGITAITPIMLKDREIIEGQLKNYSFDCPTEITAEYGVNYTRVCYNDGNWETIILPFAVEEFSAFDDYIIEGFKYENLEEGQLIFTKLESITGWEANKAYIMKSKDSSEEVSFEFRAGAGAKVKTALPANGFTGTYNTLTTGDLATCYVLNATGSQFGKVGNNNQLPAFRGYYIPSEGSYSRPFSVVHERATNINSLKVINTIYVAGGVIYLKTDSLQVVNVYSIDGVLVTARKLTEGWNTIEGLAKGIYIINGEKIVL